MRRERVLAAIHDEVHGTTRYAYGNAAGGCAQGARGRGRGGMGANGVVMMVRCSTLGDDIPN